MVDIEYIEKHRLKLESTIRSMLADIGDIPIGTPGQFPFGWRKAAKGRTVWRLLEEVISQNLESRSDSLGIENFTPAASEVGVYDFSFRFEDSDEIFINVKSAVIGGRTNKDDISKADKLLSFYRSTENCNLMILTVVIEFLSNPLRVRLANCHVVPICWLPDIYVNPSNNGNLQSSKYKDIASAERRLPAQFLLLLEQAIQTATGKRHKKINITSGE
jgi:hypothetical protein